MYIARFVRPIAPLAVLLLVSATSLAQSAPRPETSAQGPALASRSLADHVPVLPSTLAKAWAVDPEKGVASRDVGGGVHVITDGVWQSAFVVTQAGVIVIDAPETYADKIRPEIAAVTSQPVTTLIYTHTHKDHIGGSAAFADIEGLEIVALSGVAEFLAEKADPHRLVPTRTFDEELVLDRGGVRIELRGANYHSDEGDAIVYIPHARFLMAVDTLAPGYCPFMGFDITSNFHEYLHVFDTLLDYDFDVFVGGHLTHPGTRSDVELSREFTLDVYETVKRVHGETDLMGVFAETAGKVGSWDNKFLLFQRFLDVVTERATAELESRWIDRLAGIDVFTKDHVRTALLYVRWDD